MRVKCLAQEHNTMSPARPRTRTTRSGVERTNHEATTPPTPEKNRERKFFSNLFDSICNNTLKEGQEEAQVACINKIIRAQKVLTSDQINGKNEYGSLIIYSKFIYSHMNRLKIQKNNK